MTPDQKYLFDLNGYIVIKNALSPDEVTGLTDSAYRMLREKYAPNDPIWGSDGLPQSDVRVHRPIEKDAGFLNLIDHPNTIKVIKEVTGGRPRMIDNDIDFVPRRTIRPGWHRGVDTYGYSCKDGQIFCLMVKIIHYLTGTKKGDSCTRLVPASHKSCLPEPRADEHVPGMIELETDPGDALIFAEAVLHAANSNESGKVRVNCYLNYGPSWVEPWEGYRPSEDFWRGQADSRRQLLGGGVVYANTVDEGVGMVK